MASSTQKVVSFGETDVYQSDLQLLKCPNWLNDTIINFCCDYLKLVEFTSSKHARDIVFVYPGTSFILLHESDSEDMMDTMDGQGIRADTGLALFPLNNNENVLGGGGSHWALLAYTGSDGKFAYFDSMGKANERTAKQLASQLRWGFDEQQKNKKTSTSTANGTAVGDEKTKHKQTHVEMPITAPQQLNTYDCGVYTVAIAHQLARAYVDGSGKLTVGKAKEYLSQLTPEHITNYRKTIRKWIDDVASSSQVS